ncbi:beta-lactamase family protein [bacterium]|jgi:CubicO group peptidase (beta-lactamase class C family)|nr:beta-lactamase family protein [Balneola sp.]MBR9918757.1 beta-lactamase family protein [bacterium]
MTYSLLFLSILILFSSCSQDKIEHIDGNTITEKDLTQRIQTLIDEAGVAGLAVTIFNDNEIAYQKGFGYANYETKDTLTTDQIFYGASFSKAVFGYLAADLVLDGTIDLDTPLQEYFDVPIPDLEFEKEWRGFANLSGDDRYKDITARMCLNHSTGFPNWRWLDKSFDFDRNGKIHFFFDPGARFSYSGEGMMLLQYAIEKVTGKGLEELAQERIFGPLGMTMTSYVWQERFEGVFVNGHSSEREVIPKDTEDEAGAAGSMETTPDDYAKFFGHILREASSDSELAQLMFNPSLRISSKAQFGVEVWQDTDENDDIELSYGMGWGLLKSPYGYGAFKEGSDQGWEHYSIMFPEQKTGVIIMSNSDNAEGIFKELLEITIGDVYTPWKWERYIPYDQ